jgi:uncharacterized membrane protein
MGTDAPDAAVSSDAVEIVIPATIIEDEDGDPGAASRVVVASSFVGPLPPPHLLRGYEAVLPGSADRLLAMAESALAHDQAADRHQQRMDKARMARSFGGLACGLAICLLFGWFAYRLGQQGHDWLAAVLGGADLAGLVAVFVLGLARSREDADDE